MESASSSPLKSIDPNNPPGSQSGGDNNSRMRQIMETTSQETCRPVGTCHSRNLGKVESEVPALPEETLYLMPGSLQLQPNLSITAQEKNIQAKLPNLLKLDNAGAAVDNNPSRGGAISHSYILEVDEDLIDNRFLSELPSGLVDIEGDIIGQLDLRFGLEEDELDSVDSGDYQKNSIKRCNSTLTSGDFDSMENNKSSCIHSEGSECPDEIGMIRDIDEEERSSCMKGKCNRNNSRIVKKCSFSSSLPSSPTKAVNKQCEAHRKSQGSRKISSQSISTIQTIQMRYYPECTVGWGAVVVVSATVCHSMLCGMHFSYGILMGPICSKFGAQSCNIMAGWLGALSLGISLFLSPIWVSICKRKSTRLSAVFGGLVASLGCLFTSFASQFHQLFVSYGGFMGVGVGLTRDASSLMVGQYFKKKRDFVEIFLVSGGGLGILVMSTAIHYSYISLGWRLGLQAITGSLMVTFFLSTCYRSASLYHPQRRAILHLKNQKRKVKEKEKRDEKPPFIDYNCLRSKTLQTLLLSTSFIAFGIYTPLFSLASECSKKGFEGCSLVWLHIYIGSAWIFGCIFFGILVIQKSQECRVSRQYLTQVASAICAISILGFTSVKGNNGMVVFSLVYGFSLGAYHYALKVYTYERSRARHFARAWSFVQWSQSIPLVVGVLLSGEINQSSGWKYGYILSAVSIFIGSCCLFLTDVRRRKMSRRKTQSQTSSMKTCETTDGTQSPKSKRLSLSIPAEQQIPVPVNSDEEDYADGGGGEEGSVMIKELTCISEEGLADGDFQDIYFDDDWADYLGECITSCAKVENCLASEYDYTVLTDRRARRWSAARQNANPNMAAALSIPLEGKLKGRAILGVPMLNPKLFQLNLKNRSQQKTQGKTASCSQNPEASGSTSSCSGHSSNHSCTPATTVGVIRAVPFLRNNLASIEQESCSFHSNTSVDESRENSFGIIDEESL